MRALAIATPGAALHASVWISLAFSVAAPAQSTFGTILGTVRDPSLALVPKATVTATNTDENTSRTITTNGSGDYAFLNTKPGQYKLEVKTPGFQEFTALKIHLAARQSLRVDVGLEVGPSSTSLNVEAVAGVIATESPAIQSSFDNRALLNLPSNTRASASTSAYALIASLPGVQSSDDGAYSIQGGFAPMTQYSVDGISITDVTQNGPLTEAFPSLESIAEIKVQGAGNPAEFSEVGDVTTVSKSGSNQFHGALFWYHQNRALDALAYGEQVKPRKIGNDFGARVGGPVMIPGLYFGENKTFFFGTYEGLRFPLEQTIQNTVPTQAMRAGDFSQIGVTPIDPFSGQPFANNVIPVSRISPVAQRLLQLYPLPNVGDVTTVQAAGYIDNRDNSTNTNQYDARIDHYLRPNMSVFGRWSWKANGMDFPQGLLLPSMKATDHYKLVVTSWNWTLGPNLVNEFRFGVTINTFAQRFPFDGAKFTNALGLAGIGPVYSTNNLPYVRIDGYDEINTGRDKVSESSTLQWNNNTNWVVGRHTMKFGFDIRRLKDVQPLFFLPGDNHGNFFFNGSFSGDPFADFLLGLPEHTIIDSSARYSDGRAVHYGVFAQDAFRVNSRLTLEYGLRWEYHPAYLAHTGDIGNFDPSVPASAAVIYPTGKQSLLAPLFLASFNACPAPAANGAPCTPVLSAKQAHVPESLRFNPARVVPRFGFAFRPLSDDKTVVRGGFSVYNTPSLGQFYAALTSTLQANLQYYANDSSNGPIFAWPQTGTSGPSGVPPLGTAIFAIGNQIHWKEPYTMQWNMSIDRSIGFNTGLRVSFIGMATRDLAWSANINQSAPSTQYYVSQPLSRRPFPNWGGVGDVMTGANANYRSGQAEVSHRFQYGLTLYSAFTLAKSLADNQGPNPRGFPNEWHNGSGMVNAHNRRAQYGDVSATRRLRWITIATLELPIGRGHALLSHANRLVDGVLGGWQLSNIFLIQSGPFRTPIFVVGDPSGSGSGMFTAQLPDRIKSGKLAHPTADEWFDTTAFVCPGVPGWTTGQPCTIGVDPALDLPPIGRFGNSGVSVVTGPGTVNLSTGLAKTFSVRERTKLKLEASFTNILNHVNLADPIMRIADPGFGQITSARSSDFGDYRTGQVSVRIEF